MVDGVPNVNGDALAAPAGVALEEAALPPKEKLAPEAAAAAAGLAAPNGLLAASPNVKVDVDEGVVVVVAPNEVVTAAFGCPKLKFEDDAGAAVPNVAEAAVVAAVAAAPTALVPLTLDPKANEGAPPPPPPKEKVGAAAAEAVAAAVVVAAVFPKENDGVPVALVAVAAAVTSFTDPKEKPPAPPEVGFPKENAEPDVAVEAAAEVVVAGDTDGVPNEKVGVAVVVVVAAVIFACPKLKEGAVGVGLEVVDALFELLPNENDDWVGMVGEALAAVFASSEAAVEPNEKLAAGAAGAPPPVVFPKVNMEPDVAVEAAAEVVVVVAADADGVPRVVPDVKVGFAVVVVFVCPKVKEGAAGVRFDVVVALVAELLPKESDSVAGMVGVAPAVVFALSEAADDPNEKLAAGAAGASDLPKENPGSEVVGVAAALLPDPGLLFGDAEIGGGAESATAGTAFLSASSSFFSFSFDFFSTPKLNIAAFAFSGLFLSSASFSVLEVLSPKENVTFGGEVALLESEAFEAPADWSSAAVSAPSVTSPFFFPASAPLFSSSFLSSTSAAGGPSMTSLSSKVESKSATLCPMRLLSAS